MENIKKWDFFDFFSNELLAMLSGTWTDSCSPPFFFLVAKGGRQTACWRCWNTNYGALLPSCGCSFKLNSAVTVLSWGLPVYTSSFRKEAQPSPTGPLFLVCVSPGVLDKGLMLTWKQIYPWRKRPEQPATFRKLWGGTLVAEALSLAGLNLLSVLFLYFTFSLCSVTA